MHPIRIILENYEGHENVSLNDAIKLSPSAKETIEKFNEEFAGTHPEKEIVAHVNGLYPEAILDMFDGAENLVRVPVLDVANIESGYIDYIHPQHMTHPIMRGVDHYGRGFVTFCYKLHNSDKEVTEALFQRYTYERASYWQSGTHNNRAQIKRPGSGSMQNTVVDSLTESPVAAASHRALMRFAQPKVVKASSHCANGIRPFLQAELLVPKT